MLIYLTSALNILQQLVSVLPGDEASLELDVAADFQALFFHISLHIFITYIYFTINWLLCILSIHSILHHALHTQSTFFPVEKKIKEMK